MAHQHKTVDRMLIEVIVRQVYHYDHVNGWIQGDFPKGPTAMEGGIHEVNGPMHRITRPV